MQQIRAAMPPVFEILPQYRDVHIAFHNAVILHRASKRKWWEAWDV